MKPNRLLIELSLAAFTIFILLWIFVPKFLNNQNINTPTNFPDEVFRRTVEVALKKEKDEKFKVFDAKQFTGVLRIYQVKDLTGIQFFSNITALEVKSNDIHELDLSRFAHLQELKLECPYLKTLNISNNHELISFEFKRGITIPEIIPVTHIDFSNKPKLKSIILRNALVPDFDISTCLALESLIHQIRPQDTETGRLKEIDVSNHKELRTLALNGHQLTNLDVSQNLQLTFLSVKSNPLDSLVLPNQGKLLTIDVDDEFITPQNVEYMKKKGVNTILTPSQMIK